MGRGCHTSKESSREVSMGEMGEARYRRWGEAWRFNRTVQYDTRARAVRRSMSSR